MRYRFRWWHVHALGVAAAVIVAFALGAFGASHYKTVFGQKLNGAGQKIYTGVAAKRVEGGQRNENETLPAATAARLRAANSRLAKTANPHPVTLATPEPITKIALVRNYSSRNGTRPVLLVVHDTQSPNAAGLEDVAAIDAWFNNSVSQASSNYTTDADGNTILMVRDTEKAWTQAFFNPWSISDELIGYASQTTWPATQLRAVAKIFAGEASKWGIPVQQAVINGCTIVRPGITEHLFLGACGGGHHDAGPRFPLTHFVALVKQYQAGGYHPVDPARAAAAKRHAAAVAKRAALRARIQTLRARGESWQQIETTPLYRQFRNLGGR